MLSGKIKILIVDDEAALRESLSQVFGVWGYSVHSAHDGYSALEKMKEELPDIVLSDLNMPGMSGFEFLAIVNRRFPGISAIAMSGAFSGCEMPAGVVADAFYAKGGDPGRLLRIVRAAKAQSPPERSNGLQSTGAFRARIAR